ncbi:CHAD domain-containing protein [Oxalobacteraceae bacterium OTU3CINTB1]|nr:CHAD domain-containing protein [Oxalobacteraceae bacterium OTU3CINTB1]
METELKLKVAQPDLARLREHHLLTGSPATAPVEHELHDVYYDTPNLDLWQNGLTLRVRAEAGGWTQTVKTAAQSSNGLHQRGEWESVLDGPAPEPATLAKQIKRSRIAELLRSPEIGKHLAPIFNNTTRRTSWRIVLPDGRKVECALDAGDLHVGSRNAAIGELEFELKRGNPASLFELALALHADIPFEIANDSKAARGYALLHSEPIKPVKATAVRLTKKMSLEDALQSMGLNCLAQMEANVPGVLKKSVESLHQMRVGLRRLRALLDMFEEMAPLPAQTRDSLEWLAGELGATRDWDVLAGSTLAGIQGADVSGLREIAHQRSQQLHRDMLDKLHEPRYTELILQLNGWFHARLWRAEGKLPKGSSLARPAHEAMAPLLRKAQRRLHKRIDTLDQNDAPSRHRIRIAAKKTRYAAEFFRDLLPPKQIKSYLRTLEDLQGKLGHLNDLAVAQELLAQIDAADAAPYVQYARGYVTAAAEKESRHLGRSLHAIDRMKMTR